MQINFTKNNSIVSEQSAAQADLTAEFTTENFSLILEEAVSNAREKTASADNSSAKENPDILPEKKNIPPETAQNLASLFGVKPLDINPVNKKTKNIGEVSNDEEIPAETDSETTAVPGGLIQTEIQQILVKNNSALRADALNTVSAKPKPLPAALPAVNFEDIYAQVRQALRVGKDGQILKLKFAIEPESLGKLDVYVFADKKNLHIAFASSEETRKLLEAAGADLQEILAQYGFSASDLDFSGYSGERHQELESRFLAQNSEKNDFGILKIINKKDIINEVCYLVRDVLVNYMA